MISVTGNAFLVKCYDAGSAKFRYVATNSFLKLQLDNQFDSWKDPKTWIFDAGHINGPSLKLLRHSFSAFMEFQYDYI